MQSFRFLPQASASALLLALAGCGVPDLGPRPLPRAPESIAAERSLPASAAAAWPQEMWWRDYGDPQLAALIEEGLKASPDVATATARYRRAAGIVQQTGAAGLPSLDASGKVGVQRQSLNLGYPDQFKQFLPAGWHDSAQIAASFNFDLDLWGKNRAALAAATSERRAAEVDVHQARLLLTTGIASAYVDLARLFAVRDIRAAELTIRESSRKLVADRVTQGLDTRGSLAAAEAQAATARAAVTEADQWIATRRHQLAALVGAGPDRGLEIARPAPVVLARRDLPAGATTDLIGRRPDVAAARERVEAAASRIKVARADFYPAVNLSALIGFQSLGIGNLIAGDSTFGNAGPAVTLPIFHGGALQGAYKGARATYDEAVANYDKIVLAAYQDAADAVTAQAMIAQRLAEARKALAASNEAYAIARRRYEGGLSNYLDVLSVEDRLVQARTAVAELEAAARSADVSLIRALGGGFTTGEVPHA
ncbi:MAG: efflux transporter outer membrane subunit [Novosphingobium sp.]